MIPTPHSATRQSHGPGASDGAESMKRGRMKQIDDPITAAIRDRLRRVLEPYSARQIARATGHNHETIRRYLIAGALPADFLYAVCVVYGVCPRFLLLGIGQPSTSDPALQSRSRVKSDRDPVKAPASPTVKIVPRNWQLHSPPSAEHRL